MRLVPLFADKWEDMRRSMDFGERAGFVCCGGAILSVIALVILVVVLVGRSGRKDDEPNRWPLRPARSVHFDSSFGHNHSRTQFTTARSRESSTRSR